MAVKRDRAINLGKNLLVMNSSNKPSQVNKYITLISVTGLDELPGINRNMQERVLANGSIPSLSATWKARDIKLEAFIDFGKDGNTNVRTVRTAITKLAEYINNYFSFSAIYYENNKETMREVLMVLPGDNFLEKWEQTYNGVFFTLNFIAPNPFKTIYLNGKTKPESKTRL